MYIKYYANIDVNISPRVLVPKESPTSIFTGCNYTLEASVDLQSFLPSPTLLPGLGIHVGTLWIQIHQQGHDLVLVEFGVGPGSQFRRQWEKKTWFKKPSKRVHGPWGSKNLDLVDVASAHPEIRLVLVRDLWWTNTPSESKPDVKMFYMESGTVG